MFFEKIKQEHFAPKRNLNKDNSELGAWMDPVKHYLVKFLPLYPTALEIVK